MYIEPSNKMKRVWPFEHVETNHQRPCPQSVSGHSDFECQGQAQLPLESSADLEFSTSQVNIDMQDIHRVNTEGSEARYAEPPLSIPAGYVLQPLGLERHHNSSFWDWIELDSNSDLLGTVVMKSQADRQVPLLNLVLLSPIYRT